MVSGDLLDRAKFYSSVPGAIPAFALILLVYRNIHNYNYWVSETATLLFSSVFYGFALSCLLYIKKWTKAQQLNRGDRK